MGDLNVDPISDVQCKGCYALDSACGKCWKCKGERNQLWRQGLIEHGTHEEAVAYYAREKQHKKPTLGDIARDLANPVPDFSEIGKQRSTAADLNDKNLHCHGCAHSAGSAPFPGQPSGERPCFFCVRNPDREKWQKDNPIQAWYDGSPIAFYPMDAYQTIDMKEQFQRWEEKAKGNPNWNEPKGGLRFG